MVVSGGVWHATHAARAAGRRSSCGNDLPATSAGAEPWCPVWHATQFGVLKCWWNAALAPADATGAPFVVRNPISDIAWHETHRSDVAPCMGAWQAKQSVASSAWAEASGPGLIMKLG
jgi:hypothetical protein